MAGLTQLHRLERWMIYVRWFGVLFALAAVVSQREYPNPTTQRAAAALVALLALGNLAVWAGLGRLRSERQLRVLGVAAFALDAFVVMGLVWAFAYEDPYMIWGLLLLLPIEGALRYRLTGALIAAVVVAMFFFPQSLRRAELSGRDFDSATYVFVIGLATLVAGVTGAMADNWHAQSRALLHQSLKLAELDRLKDRFLAVTSHEIRGPLAAIITGVETIHRRRERLRTDQLELLLEMVSQQGHQLARLIDDLLVTSQLQAGKLTLHPRWTDLQSAIKSSLEAAASKRQAQQLEVFVEPIRCEIDESRVSQIVRNLAENAYKYTPERTRVAVTGRGVDGGVVLEVADDGQGIPADKRDRLFEAFSRIEETAAGKDGVGLGLYVVSHLVGAMDGRIDLHSSSNGTTFSIFIPCRREAADDPLVVTQDGVRHAG